jgi:hypothetical protein
LAELKTEFKEYEKTPESKESKYRVEKEIDELVNGLFSDSEFLKKVELNQ